MSTVNLHCDAGYGRHTVLRNVDVDIAPGVTVLVGTNGAGKSTLLRTLAALQAPLSGSVRIDGRDVSAMTRRQLAQTLSFVYTDRTVSGGLTVRELVEMGRHPYTGILGYMSADDRRIVDEALRNVGIAHKSDAFLSQISDGERQKAMIARVLAQQTSVILLDEPTSFLDPASRLDIMRLLQRLSREHDKTIVLSTHDISSALGVADRVMCIADGSVTLTDVADRELLTQRMDAAFAGRGIRFDAAVGDFVIA